MGRTNRRRLLACGVVVVAAPIWVDTPAALSETLEHLRTAVAEGKRIALDTEFHSEHRYRPRLMLIQLATTAGEAILIDPLALPDLRGLGEVLQEAELILHAPGQDLPLLARRCGLQPNKLQDPQLMAGFCGLGHPRSLAALCSDVLGRSLKKGSTLSDWKQRPLSPEQQDYAADDVRYLHQLVETLEARLPQELRAPLAACTAERSAAALSLPPVENAWRRFGVARVLDAPSLCALVTLCTWRETQARERDQPPRQVLGDGLLIDLARRLPESLRSWRATDASRRSCSETKVSFCWNCSSRARTPSPRACLRTMSGAAPAGPAWMPSSQSAHWRPALPTSCSCHTKIVTGSWQVPFTRLGERHS